jgi:type VI secretion system protein ImpG
MRDQEELLSYYRSELAQLRQAGQGFARKYPKLAERLELSADGSADPHVERLIESFSFLSARIQRRLDDEFPEITAALLSSLFPHLAHPIPPLSVAQFLPDSARGKLDSGYLIPRHTALFAQTMDGLDCRFQTSYPVTLWPLRVTEAHFEPKTHFDFLDNHGQVASVLRLRIEAEKAKLADLSLKTLRFHLYGDSDITGGIYEALFADCIGVVLYDEDAETAIRLPKNAIEAVGFGEEEDVIPYGNSSHPGYRLLQEYFALPDKFLFFDLQHLEKNPSSSAIDVLFLLKTPPRPYLQISSANFLLGCTPIVNLFRRTSEPIRLDHTKSEYRLVPDMRRERTTEVHSVLSVRATSDPSKADRVFQPIYSATVAGSDPHNPAYWFARRAATGRSDLSGTEVFLSFVDPSFRPTHPPDQTVFAQLLCTNRDLATQIPENAVLQTEERGPIARIRCLRKPTATAYPPLGGTSRWALISNLSLNYMSISDSPDSLQAFKQILLLYSLSPTPAILQQIEGMRTMTSRPVTRRLGIGWKGFCSGKEIHLSFNEQCYSGSSLYLFATVISRFLGLYSAINSFTQLAISREQANGEVIRFPPVVGSKPIL